MRGGHIISSQGLGSSRIEHSRAFGLLSLAHCRAPLCFLSAVLAFTPVRVRSASEMMFERINTRRRAPMRQACSKQCRCNARALLVHGVTRSTHPAPSFYTLLSKPVGLYLLKIAT